jgi:hypothetical protein
MFLRIHRIGAIVVFILGIGLAVSVSIYDISPVIWASLPVLCLSVIAGVGLGGLAVASNADGFWLTACSFMMAGLTLLCSIMSLHYPRLVFASAWYLLAAILCFTILLFAATGKTYHKLRLCLFALALACDIFLSAGYIIDKLF